MLWWTDLRIWFANTFCFVRAFSGLHSGSLIVQGEDDTKLGIHYTPSSGFGCGLGLALHNGWIRGCCNAMMPVGCNGPAELTYERQRAFGL